MSKPRKGDYVLATKWSDGNPGDHWCVGFYDRSDASDRPPATRIDPRHYVVDNAGRQFRANGFRRAEKITRAEGDFILARKDMIDAPGYSGPNLWELLLAARSASNRKDIKLP